MITWGISANSHDAALAVFADEKLVFASHSERFSGIKNDPHLDQGMIDYARKQWGNPNNVCWYERPIVKSVRQLFAGQGLTFKENNVKKYLRYGINYPHSVGLWYSAMTQRIGLKPNEEEYILMGMAAYGDPKRLYDDVLHDFISFPDDGNLLCIKQNLHRGCREWRPDLTTEQDMFDIAASTQAVYETVFDQTLQYAQQLVDSKNVVIMGGCALNCVANSIAYKYYDNVYIMPNPGDAGSAIGSVLAQHPAWRHFQTQPFNPFLGYDMGYQVDNKEIVDYLIENKICGLARGPAEYGPRALGNRSLIADPRGDNIKDKVNEIKRRQKFRPFAPAILAELANDYFNIPGGSSPYMQVVARCKYPELFPAIVHYDGTSRVQTVEKDGSPFRQLLELWYARTGCPMLLNTSLNIKGEPMVNDQEDADKWSRKYGLPVFN